MIQKDNKIWIFIRAYNDLDNIIPVVYKLILKKVGVHIIITGSKSLLQDYRLKYLKNIGEFHLESINKYRKPLIFRLLGNLNDPNSLKELIYYELMGRSPNSPLISDVQIADKLMKTVDEGDVICFDWDHSLFAQKVCKLSREKGVVTIALPHACSPCLNYLLAKEAISLRKSEIKPHLDTYDFNIQPNTINQQRSLHIGTSIKEKLPILGSPRYSKEWVNKHAEFADKYDWKGPGKVNFVFFLRDSNCAVHLEEMFRSLAILRSYLEVNLVIKYHTRISRKSIRLMKFHALDKHPNVRTAKDDISSISLIIWSDVVVNLGTSAAFDAVWFNKKIFSPEYLHPNISATGHYFPSSEIKTRDQWHDMTQKAITSTENFTYSEEERQKFIKEMIEIEDEHVLDRYAKFITVQLKNIPSN
ncbi:MAG: hypothetical protein JXQ90_23415 [Cyclobacteriaceae bacterium]